MSSKTRRMRKVLGKRSHQALNERGRTMYDILKLATPKLDLRNLADTNLFK